MLALISCPTPVPGSHVEKLKFSAVYMLCLSGGQLLLLQATRGYAHVNPENCSHPMAKPNGNVSSQGGLCRDDLVLRPNPWAFDLTHRSGGGVPTVRVIRAFDVGVKQGETDTEGGMDGGVGGPHFGSCQASCCSERS